MGLNPSAADGLQACTDAQFGKGTRNPVACPAARGRHGLDRDPAAAGRLADRHRLPRPAAQPRPDSGKEYRIFVDAESARYGVSVRLIGKVAADPKTGQLTTASTTDPQVPFTSFKLDFDGGQGRADQPAHLRPEHDHPRDDRLDGHARPGARRQAASP